MSRREKRRKRGKKKARQEQNARSEPGYRSSTGRNLESRADRPTSGVDLDRAPRLDQLDALLASQTPTAAGAWWTTVLLGQHVVEMARLRDRRSGEELSRPLRDVLSSVSEAVATGVIPRPADEVHQASVLVREALQNIVGSPRSRLVRSHDQRPVHALREMDARCMMWLAKQPGRTTREKLGGQRHALSVVRRFSLDTQENRVLRRLIDSLVRRLGSRFEPNTTFDEAGLCDGIQRETVALCRRALGTTELGMVRPSEDPRPNNALLGDANYARIWRAWMVLREAEDKLSERWKSAPEVFTGALFWAVVGSLWQGDSARVNERTVMIGETTSEGVVDVLLTSSSDQVGGIVGWVEFIAHGSFAAGRVKKIDTHRSFGFVTDEAGDDFYFGPHTLQDGTTFSSIHEGALVMFRASESGRKQRRPSVESMLLVTEEDQQTLKEQNGGWVTVALSDGGRVVLDAKQLGDKKERPPLDVGDKVHLPALGGAQSAETIRLCPPTSAELVQVWHSDERLGMRRFGLGPCLDGAFLGRVKFTKTRGEKLFGYLRAMDGRDHHFEPGTVGNVFRKLRRGTWVTFRLTSNRKRREVVSDIRIIDSPAGMRTAPIRLMSECEWTVELPRGRSLLSNRGAPVVLAAVNQGRRTEGWGDLKGIRCLRQVVLDEVGLSAPPHRVLNEDSTLLRNLGIDASGWNIRVGGPLNAQAQTLPYLNIQSGVRAEPELGPMGHSCRLPVLEDGHDVCSLATIFEGGDDPLSIIAGRRVFRSLAEELKGHVESAAYIVPDDLDEFSQQALRAAVASGFPNALPLARSVAAALAWQEGKGFNGVTVKDGDVVVVLSSDLSRLAVTVLVARVDSRLCDEHPDTLEVYWERRPAVAVEEFGEGLGRLVLWREYTRQLIDSLGGALGIDIDKAVDYLVNTGIVQEVAWTGLSQWLRVGDRWFSIEHDHRLWVKVVKRWCSRFDRAFRAGLGDVLSSGMPRAKRAHLLLVGRPFNEPTAHSLARSLVSSACRGRLVSTSWVSDEAGDLAEGAAAFSRRVSSNLPVWRDWLPDLFLEVVRDGLFDELELMKDVVVDAALGSLDEVDVPETLVLPHGVASYRFSLVAGRANRRPMPVDFQLDSSAFPLREDVCVRLRLAYRYGVDNGYELSVISLDSDTPFSEVQGTWVSSGHEPSGAETAPSLLTTPISSYEWNDRVGSVIDSMRGALWRLRLLLSGDDGDPGRTALTLCRQMRWLRFQLLEFSVLGDPAQFVESMVGSEFAELLLEIVEGEELFGFDERMTSRLQGEALIFLCVLNDREAVGIVERLLHEDFSEEFWLPDAIMALHQRSPDFRWMDRLWELVLTEIEPYENPRLYGNAVRALGRTVWRVDGFLVDFADRHRDFVSHALHIIESGVRSTVSRAARAVEPDSGVRLDWGHVGGVQAKCELMLGLLALRGTPHGESLAVGSSRMMRLAKAIRRADCLITKAGKTVRSALGLEVTKPDELAQVSDLVFVLNSYLTGAAGLETIRIDSFTEDEPT